jgi:calcium-independent phospholipase A2-gamma
MRHLAVSIAATIDKPWQWKLFFDEGGGVLPLLECIRDGARSVQKGNADFMDGDVEGTAILMEQHEASFAAACTACRALRDLSALSKDFSAVVTDDILKVNEQWSTCVIEGEGHDCSSGGLVSDLLILLKHANEPTELFSKSPKRGSGRSSFSLSSKRRRRDARRRCGMYVVQLMLSMAMASDKAVATLRSTSGLIEEIVQCSSYAPSERFKRKWIRKPLEFVENKLPGLKRNRRRKDGWIPSGVRGSLQENANKLLAAMGHNIWIPKQPGQRGLRVLSLDGGGTRGIAAVQSIGHIVEAMKGIEVCDAFDMIVGTSTGAIIAFLVGLRRESAADARIRYDTLIRRIFVKSLLKPIMLATTTASYDEANLLEVLNEVLHDEGMLDSRASPSVPLVTAISSKMSSTPTQLCLLRNYNYGGGEMPDSFIINPDKARKRLGLDDDDVKQVSSSEDIAQKTQIKCAPRTGMGSRYPGSFRVTQKIALRATTAAPTFFKPLLSFDELYVDGGIVASNPTAVAVHEARTVFPGVPLELIVSVGTGVFNEVKIPPRVGWDGVVSQILDSATDAEQVHHVMEDVFGGTRTARHGNDLAGTKYFRFNAVVGDPDSFPIDETNPDRLQELCDIVDAYMAEEEQQDKLRQLGEIVNPQYRLKRSIRR